MEEAEERHQAPAKVTTSTGLGEPDVTWRVAPPTLTGRRVSQLPQPALFTGLLAPGSPLLLFHALSVKLLCFPVSIVILFHSSFPLHTKPVYNRLHRFHCCLSAESPCPIVNLIHLTLIFMTIFLYHFSRQRLKCTLLSL